MATSQNGYTANDLSRTKVWTIPGTVRTVRLRFGSPGELLTLWAAWFHEEIEDIEVGVFDDWGYAERPIRGSSTTLSNHASGTALDLNATRHPLGVPTTRTFTDAQIRKIRARLRDFDGCIRWGGDYTGRPDAMHFEINASVEKCDATLKKLKTKGDDMPLTDVDVKKVIDGLRPVIREEVAKVVGDVVPVDENDPAYNPKNPTVRVATAVSWILKRTGKAMSQPGQ